MCYQCLLSGGNSIALGTSHGLGEPRLRSIPVEQLIASDFESFTKQQVLTDGVLDIYLHRPAGPATVNGGGYGAQTIQTLVIDEAFAVFFRNAVEKLDAEIDLDFRFVDAPDVSDIRFYFDSEISLGDGVTIMFAKAVNRVAQKLWRVVLASIPLRISVGILQPEISRHIQNLQMLGQSGDNVLRGRVRKPADHRIDIGPIGIFYRHQSGQI